jgi:hypothetical protein
VSLGKFSTFEFGSKAFLFELAALPLNKAWNSNGTTKISTFNRADMSR